MNYLSHSSFATSKQISTITGYNLALAERTKTECALVGAKLALGRLQLVNPRVSQVVNLVHVSRPMVEAAIAVLKAAGGGELLEQVKLGHFSLIEAAVLAKHPNQSKTLTETYVAASPTDIADLARTAGPAVLWDQLISPYV